MALDDTDRIAIVNAIKEGFAAPGKSSGFNSSGSGGGGATLDGKALQLAGGLLGSVFKDAANVVAKGGGRLSDAIDKTAGALGKIIGYVEDTNDEFRKLSKVGAGFGADLSELRMSAAQTRMPLEKFANMVGQNAAALSGFSGGATAGAKAFTKLSNEMFNSNLIDQFTNLGLSIEESNEFLMQNMQLDRRRARLTNMSSAQQVESALQLAKSMDVMARLTGKSVKEQQDSLTAKMRDGATQAKLRLLEMDGVVGASQAYKQSQAALEGSPKVVGDLLADLTQTGVPMTEATKNFAATNAEAYKLLQQSASATKRGDVASAEKLAQEAAAATAKFASSRQGLTLSTLAQVSDVAQGQANRLEDMTDLIDAIGDHQQKMSTATGKTATAMEAYADMVRNAVDLQTVQTSGTSAAQAASQAVNQGQVSLANNASKVNQQIAGVMDTKSGSTMLNGLTDAIVKVNDVLTDGAAVAVNLFGGTDLQDAIDNSSGQNKTDLKTVADPTSSETDKAAATSRLIKSGTFAADGSLNVTLIKNLSAQTFDNNKVEARAESGNSGSITDTILNSLGLGKTPKPRKYGGPMKANQPYTINEGDETENFVPGMDGSMIPNIKNIASRLPAAMDQLQREMAQFGVPISESAKMAAATKAGNPASSMSSMSGMGGDDLSTLIKQGEVTIELLNRIAGINTTQARNSEKQLRSVRSAGNLMIGIGRA